MKKSAGIAVLTLAAAVAGASAGNAYSYKILHRFKGGKDGALPYGRLLLDKSGDLWGTTLYGGAGKCPFGNAPQGCGTVFKIAPDGEESTVVAFSTRAQGFQPMGGLLADAAADVYGTTFYGGKYRRGNVLKISADGQLSEIYTFRRRANGKYPLGGLTMDRNGNLYGATLAGGHKWGSLGCGTVIEISPEGAEKVLHKFSLSRGDGCNPDAPILMDQAENIFGTAYQGGAHGAGIVFKLDRKGEEFILYSFRGGEDGHWPTSPLAEDASGNLYGGTESGGPYSCGGFEYNCGVLYRVAPDGAESITHAFRGSPDGSNPANGVVIDSSGIIYGTTQEGGSAQCDCGIAYRIARDGTETILHTFGAGTDGVAPTSQLTIGHDGTLYGVTEFGGGYACAPVTCGTVFRLAR